MSARVDGKVKLREKYVIINEKDESVDKVDALKKVNKRNEWLRLIKKNRNSTYCDYLEARERKSNMNKYVFIY